MVAIIITVILVGGSIAIHIISYLNRKKYEPVEVKEVWKHIKEAKKTNPYIDIKKPEVTSLLIKSHASRSDSYNTGDLTVLLAEFGQEGENLQSDLNGDGVVNSADLAIMLSNFGEAQEEPKDLIILASKFVNHTTCNLGWDCFVKWRKPDGSFEWYSGYDKVEWLYKGEVRFTGARAKFNTECNADTGFQVPCNGVFPVKIRVTDGDFVYERTLLSLVRVDTRPGSNEPACEDMVGGYTLNDYEDGFNEEGIEEYGHCVNCNDNAN